MNGFCRHRFLRDFIISSLSELLYKKIGVSKDSTLELIDFLTHCDRKAVTVAEATYATYDKDSSEVVGYTRLLEVLTQFRGTNMMQFDNVAWNVDDARIGTWLYRERI